MMWTRRFIRGRGRDNDTCSRIKNVVIENELGLELEQQVCRLIVGLVFQ